MTVYVGVTRHWKDPLDCHICNDWAHDRTTPHSQHIGWYYSDRGTMVGPLATESEAEAKDPDERCYCKVCGEAGGAYGSSMYGSVHKYGPTTHDFEPEWRAS